MGKSANASGEGGEKGKTLRPDNLSNGVPNDHNINTGVLKSRSNLTNGVSESRSNLANGVPNDHNINTGVPQPRSNLVNDVPIGRSSTTACGNEGTISPPPQSPLDTLQDHSTTAELIEEYDPSELEFRKMACDLESLLYEGHGNPCSMRSVVDAISTAHLYPVTRWQCVTSQFGVHAKPALGQDGKFEYRLALMPYADDVEEDEFTDSDDDDYYGEDREKDTEKADATWLLTTVPEPPALDADGKFVDDTEPDEDYIFWSYSRSYFVLHSHGSEHFAGLQIGYLQQRELAPPSTTSNSARNHAHDSSTQPWTSTLLVLALRPGGTTSFCDGLFIINTSQVEDPNPLDRSIALEQWRSLGLADNVLYARVCGVEDLANIDGKTSMRLESGVVVGKEGCQVGAATIRINRGDRHVMKLVLDERCK